MADSTQRDKASRMLRVFLCHASGDKPAVRKLHQRLCAEGVDAWLDEEKLLPGHDWPLEISKAVRASDVVIICLSRGSITKEGFVQKEIRLALDVADEKPEGTIFLIPARLEACEVPERLNRWHWVNLYEARGHERLMRALQARAKTLGISVTPPEMQDWQISLRDTTRTTFGGIEFVRVPAGKFIMGSKDDNPQAYDDEKPQHTVEIPYDYWIARYPATNDQFAAFVEAAKYKHELAKDWRDKSNHPVVYAPWHDAVAYCKWLNETLRSEIGKMVVRLPTEAEWEKAARGQHGNEWPWGNEFDASRCNSSEGGKGDTTPVGAYSPQGDSPYGAADMAGNVLEWCHSLYGPYPYRANDGRESESGTDLRVLRGGAFNYYNRRVRCACRSAYVPDVWSIDVGFRVVVASPL